MVRWICEGKQGCFNPCIHDDHLSPLSAGDPPNSCPYTKEDTRWEPTTELLDIPTCDLVNELAKREGVQAFSVKSRQEEIIASRLVPVSQYGLAQPETIFFGIFGPVHILVVKI